MHCKNWWGVFYGTWSSALEEELLLDLGGALKTRFGPVELGGFQLPFGPVTQLGTLSSIG